MVEAATEVVETAMARAVKVRAAVMARAWVVAAVRARVAVAKMATSAVGMVKVVTATVGMDAVAAEALVATEKEAVGMATRVTVMVREHRAMVVERVTAAAGKEKEAAERAMEVEARARAAAARAAVTATAMMVLAEVTLASATVGQAVVDGSHNQYSRNTVRKGCTGIHSRRHRIAHLWRMHKHYCTVESYLSQARYSDCAGVSSVLPTHLPINLLHTRLQAAMQRCDSRHRSIEDLPRMPHQ